MNGFILAKPDSIVDLITNSSTTVYIQYSNINSFFIDMFEEFAKAHGIVTDIRKELKVHSIPEYAYEHYEDYTRENDVKPVKNWEKFGDVDFTKQIWLKDENFRKFLNSYYNSNSESYRSDFIFVEYLTEEAKTKYEKLVNMIESLRNHLEIEALYN